MKFIIIVSAFSIVSCGSVPKFTPKFDQLDSLKVNDAVKHDLANGFQDITRDHMVGIGENIYPNSNKYDLTIPKTLSLKTSNFVFETEYYFTSGDSIVRVTLYQWDKAGVGNQSRKFQFEFNRLKEILINHIGPPDEIEIGHIKFNEETYRDGVKWTAKNKIRAYLFMFGNDITEYNQIRLALYKD